MNFEISTHPNRNNQIEVFHFLSDEYLDNLLSPHSRGVFKGYKRISVGEWFKCLIAMRCSLIGKTKTRSFASFCLLTSQQPVGDANNWHKFRWQTMSMDVGRGVENENKGFCFWDNCCRYITLDGLVPFRLWPFQKIARID